MEKITVHHDVHIQVPYDNIMARLGYNRHKTRIESEQRDKIDTYIEQAASLCNTIAIWTISPVDVSSDTVIFDSNTRVESQAFAAYMRGGSHAAVMCASAGSEITREIATALDHNEVVKAAIYDAVGSEIADGILDWAQTYLQRTLLRTYGTVAKRRFSPGYQDLSLSYQKVFHDMLHLSEYGITINERFYLQPEKSVLAICKTG